MIYLELYLSFLKIGLLSVGGGYASLAVVHSEIVDIKMWLTQTEFLDMLTIAEITPGPIALNTATFVGAKSSGALGAVCSTAGFLTMPAIITAVMGKLYFKYNKTAVMQGVLSAMRPAAAGLISAAAASVILAALWGETAVSFGLSGINITAVLLMIIGLMILWKFKPNPAVIILSAGIAGIFLYL